MGDKSPNQLGRSQLDENRSDGQATKFGLGSVSVLDYEIIVVFVALSTVAQPVCQTSDPIRTPCLIMANVNFAIILSNLSWSAEGFTVVNRMKFCV